MAVRHHERVLAHRSEAAVIVGQRPQSILFGTEEQVDTPITEPVHDPQNVGLSSLQFNRLCRPRNASIRLSRNGRNDDASRIHDAPGCFFGIVAEVQQQQYGGLGTGRGWCGCRDR